MSCLMVEADQYEVCSAAVRGDEALLIADASQFELAVGEVPESLLVRSKRTVACEVFEFVAAEPGPCGVDAWLYEAPYGGTRFLLKNDVS